MKYNCPLVYAICAAALSLPLSAVAQLVPRGNCLLGSTVTVDSYFPNLSSLNLSHPANPQIVVDPGIEFGPITFPNGSQFPWQFDFFDMKIDVSHLGSFNNFGGAAFNGFVFTFPGLTNTISSVTVNGASTLNPFAVTFNSNTIFVNYQGLGVIGPSVTKLDVMCVPEPCTASILSLGLGWLAVRRRRRMKVS